MLQLLSKDPRVAETTEGVTDFQGADMSKPIIRPNPPTNRIGCPAGTGFASHIEHNENPCLNCIEGNKKRQRDWFLANKERAYETGKRHREANKEKFKARNAENYKKNAQKIKEQKALAYLNNQEEMRRRSAEYKAKNPDRGVFHKNKRRALKLNAPSEPYSAGQILALYGTYCYNCHELIDLNAPRHSNIGIGWEMGLQLDHVIPLSKGGSDLISNIRPSHAKCNLHKNAKIGGM